MKNKRLLNVLCEIDDRHIIEAAPSVKKQSQPKWIKLCAAAACLVIVLSMGIMFIHNDDDLPMLSISEIKDEGKGFEGYFAQDIDELKNNNPWNQDTELKSLPVYRNTMYRYTDNWIVTEPNVDKMKKLIIDTANKLDMSNISVTENIPDGYTCVESFSVEDENYKINVNAWMNVNIDFKKKDILPNGYSIGSYNSYEELYKTAQFLQTEYATLLNMHKPSIDISLGDYDVYGNRLWNISFYDTSESTTESIINYNFKRVYFYSDEEGNLSMASYPCVDLEDTVGEYPIISADEALKLLCDGKYISSITEGFPGKELVKKVELIYRSETKDEFFMPYYKFYVQMDSHNVSSEELDLICFGAFYVPAVESKYIKNMPQWDGSFN